MDSVDGVTSICSASGTASLTSPPLETSRQRRRLAVQISASWARRPAGFRSSPRFRASTSLAPADRSACRANSTWQSSAQRPVAHEPPPLYHRRYASGAATSAHKRPLLRSRSIARSLDAFAIASTRRPRRCAQRDARIPGTTLHERSAAAASRCNAIQTARSLGSARCAVRPPGSRARPAPAPVTPRR